MRILISLLVIFISAVTSVDGSIKRIPIDFIGAISASRFEVVDIPFVAKEKCLTPFDVDLMAVFISPTGRELRVPAFYNGGGEWVVRFSAGEVGEWSYSTSSDLRSISGRKGLLTISDSVYGGRHGGLVVSKESPTKFGWEDSSPCFISAFGCDFLFALDYHNAAESPNLDSFVEGVASHGFNYVAMNVYGYDKPFDFDPSVEKYALGGDGEIYPFWGSNDESSYKVLNINFFKRLDRVVERLNDSNVVAQLEIYNWDSGVNWAVAGSQEDNRYFDYVVKRYQPFSNVVWSLSGAIGEGVSDDFIVVKSRRLRDKNPFGRLITVGDDGFCQRNSGAVDFISRINRAIQSDRKAVAKPTLSIDHGGLESCGYDMVRGVYADPEQCLRRSYEVIFSGQYTTYYWQGAAWSLLFPDFESLPEGVVRPKLEYYNYLNIFFTTHQFCHFKPVSGVSDSSLSMVDLDGATYLFYMPKELYRLSADALVEMGQRFLFQWFNTITGEYSDVFVCSDVSAQAMPLNPCHMQSDAILMVKILE